MAKKIHTSILIGLVSFISFTGLSQNDDRMINEFKGHLRFLSDDLLQGRFPGTPGGNLAALYIASRFEAMGLKPALKDNSYLQPVPVKCFSTDYKSATVSIKGDGVDKTIQPMKDIMIFSPLNQKDTKIEGDLVFAGYGVSAPEYNRDDFKGFDMKGKIMVVLSNHPDFKSPLYKKGNTTYYGYWPYKPKMAFDKGADGIMIIIENQSLFSWSSWQRFLEHNFYYDGMETAMLPMISYISEDEFDLIMKKRGLTTKDLTEKANDENFSPIDLNMKMKANFSTKMSEIVTPNVIGEVTGSKNPDEAVIYMAHYDHLGMGKAVNGDSIYNGAIDNASGVAGLLTLAEYFAMNPPERSVIFMATTAEEMGELGTGYYFSHPVVPPEKTIIGINMDMLGFMGKSDSIDLTPVIYTDAVQPVSDICREQGLNLILSDNDREFLAFRVETFPFAMHDIVAINFLNANINGKYPEISDEEMKSILNAGGLNYHQLTDEIKPWFRYDGISRQLELAKKIGIYFANDAARPKYKADNPFVPVKKLWKE